MFLSRTNPIALNKQLLSSGIILKTTFSSFDCIDAIVQKTSTTNNPEVSTMKVNEFVKEFGKISIKFQLVWLKNSVYVWIAEGTDNIQMENLDLFYGTSKSTIVGASNPLPSLGEKLSKKLKIPVFLSINIRSKQDVLFNELIQFIERVLLIDSFQTFFIENV